jgi:hypothetical protein
MPTEAAFGNGPWRAHRQPLVTDCLPARANTITAIMEAQVVERTLRTWVYGPGAAADTSA